MGNQTKMPINTWQCTHRHNHWHFFRRVCHMCFVNCIYRVQWSIFLFVQFAVNWYKFECQRLEIGKLNYLEFIVSRQENINTATDNNPIFFVVCSVLALFLGSYASMICIYFASSSRIQYSFLCLSFICGVPTRVSNWWMSCVLKECRSFANRFASHRAAGKICQMIWHVLTFSINPKLLSFCHVYFFLIWTHLMQSSGWLTSRENKEDIMKCFCSFYHSNRRT